MISKYLRHFHLHHHCRAGDWFDVGNQRDWLFPPFWPSDFKYSISSFNFQLNFSLWWYAFCLLCWHFFLLHRLRLFVTKSLFFKFLFSKGSLMVPHPHSCRRNLSDLPTILIKRWQDWPVSWKSSSWHFSARPGRPSYFACLTTKRNHLNTALVWPRATNSYIFTFFDGKCVLSLIDPNLKDDHIGSM